jgi:hypothetical protein
MASYIIAGETFSNENDSRLSRDTKNKHYPSGSSQFLFRSSRSVPLRTNGAKISPLRTRQSRNIAHKYVQATEYNKLLKHMKNGFT